MSTKIIAVRMDPRKAAKIIINPTLLNVKAIQLIECHKKYEGFLLFCDQIDSNFAMTNVNETNPNYHISHNPGKLIAVLSESKHYPIIPFRNKRELSKLLLYIKI